MSHMWHDRVCDTYCNNLECGYDDGICTLAQIQSNCLSQIDLSGVDYSSPPQQPNGAGSLVPVQVFYDFEPARIQMDTDLNEAFALVSMDYTLRWNDHRMASGPCAGAIERMLSLTKEDGASDNARTALRTQNSRFYQPKLEGEQLMPQFDLWDQEATFQLEERPQYNATRDPASVHYIPVNPDPSVGWVSYTATIEAQVMQPQFRYFEYPFDKQTIIWEINVPGADLTNCEGNGETSTVLSATSGFSAATAEELILPRTKEWQLDGALTESITFAHGADDNGNADRSKCVMSIKVYRTATVYLVKGIFNTIILVLGSLLTTLFLHPEDMIGDRCNVLFIAFLILITNMQTDLGLGRLSYLIWLDYFNLIQLVMVLAMVGETMVVHRHMKTREVKQGIHLDATSRRFIPWGFYIVITLSTVLYFDKDNRAIAIAVGVVGIFFCSLGARWHYRYSIVCVHARPTSCNAPKTCARRVYTTKF